MPVVVAGEEFQAAHLTNMAVVGLGARVEQPVTRAIVSAWRAATRDPDTGVWDLTQDAPLVAGEYQLVWRTNDGDPPSYEAFVPLIVSAAPVAPPVDPAVWAPSLVDIALVTPAYTRGGFDDDRPQAGGEIGTFTADTSPTADHVTGLITAACNEVIGRVGVAIPEHLFALARTTATWHVAAAISAGKLPAQTEDASGEYRSHISNFRACLDELVAQARRTPLRVS